MRTKHSPRPNNRRNRSDLSAFALCLAIFLPPYVRYAARVTVRPIRIRRHTPFNNARTSTHTQTDQPPPLPPIPQEFPQPPPQPFPVFDFPLLPSPRSISPSLEEFLEYRPPSPVRFYPPPVEAQLEEFPRNDPEFDNISVNSEATTVEYVAVPPPSS
nr:PREDICTED: leucine-rich repeat extensin-like protein 6 [Linepithema humile]